MRAGTRLIISLIKVEYELMTGNERDVGPGITGFCVCLEVHFH